MADVKKILSQLQSLYADNNAGDISPQDLRDGIKTLYGSYSVRTSSSSTVLTADDIFLSVTPNVSTTATVTVPLANGSDGTGDTFAGKYFIVRNDGLGTVALTSGYSTTLETSAMITIFSDGTSWKQLSSQTIATSSITNWNSVYSTVSSNSADWGSGVTSAEADLQYLRLNGTNSMQASLNLSGNGLIGTEYIDFKTSAAPTHLEGRLHWNDTDKTLQIDSDVNGTMLDIGQENWVRVRNITGNVIPNGSVVYINGASGQRPTITSAWGGNEEGSHSVIGITTHDIGHLSNGYVTTFGLVRDLNTNAYPAGTRIWLSDVTSGTWTSARPAAPNHAVSLGQVIVQNTTTGIIFVNVDNGFELNELHDVATDIQPTSGTYLKGIGTLWTSGNFSSDVANTSSVSVLTTSSSIWNNTKSVVSSNSANWNSTYTTVGSSSAGWENTKTFVANNSSDWSNAITSAEVAAIYVPYSNLGVASISAQGSILKNVNGFDDTFVDPTTATTISWSNATSALTLAPTGASYDFYANGTKVTVTSAKTLAITSNTEGRWYYFINSAGTLSVQNSITDVYEIIRDKVFVAEVYWDATNKVAISVNRETHALMPWQDHMYLHLTRGTAWESGLALNTITAGSQTVWVDSGRISDEDIRFAIAAKTSGTYQVRYKSGSGTTGVWRSVTSAAGVRTGAQGRPVYTSYNGGTSAWVDTQVNSNEYVCEHIYASTDINNPLFFITGNTSYASAAAARAGAITELTSISLTGLPSAEFKPIATILAQASPSSWTFRAVDTAGSMWIDWRGSISGGSAASGGSAGGITEVIHDATLTGTGIAGSELSVTSAAQYSSVYDTILSTSAGWEGTKSTVNINSAGWESSKSIVNSNSASWNSTTTTVSASSAGWENTKTFVQNNSADWSNALTSAEAGLKYVPYTGAAASVDIGAHGFSLTGLIDAAAATFTGNISATNAANPFAVTTTGATASTFTKLSSAQGATGIYTRMNFQGLDNVGNTNVYARTDMSVINATSGSTNGMYSIRVDANGTLAEGLRVSSTSGDISVQVGTNTTSSTLLLPHPFVKPQIVMNRVGTNYIGFGPHDATSNSLNMRLAEVSPTTLNWTGNNANLVVGNTSATGNLTVDGNTTLGNTSADTNTINGVLVLNNGATGSSPRLSDLNTSLPAVAGTFNLLRTGFQPTNRPTGGVNYYDGFELRRDGVLAGDYTVQKLWDTAYEWMRFRNNGSWGSWSKSVQDVEGIGVNLPATSATSLYVSGNLTVDGNTTLGNASSDSVSISGTAQFYASPRIAMDEPVLRIKSTSAASGATNVGYIQFTRATDGEIGYIGRKSSDASGEFQINHLGGNIKITPSSTLLIAGNTSASGTFKSVGNITTNGIVYTSASTTNNSYLAAGSLNMINSNVAYSLQTDIIQGGVRHIIAETSGYNDFTNAVLIENAMSNTTYGGAALVIPDNSWIRGTSNGSDIHVCGNVNPSSGGVVQVGSNIAQIYYNGTTQDSSVILQNNSVRVDTGITKANVWLDTGSISIGTTSGSTGITLGSSAYNPVTFLESNNILARNIPTGIIASGSNLGLDTNGKIVKATVTGSSGTTGSGAINLWTTATAYTSGQPVSYNNSIFRATSAHTSTTSFNADLNAWASIDANVVIVNKNAHGFADLTPIFFNGSVWTSAGATTDTTLATHVVLGSNTNYFIAAETGTFTITGHGKTVGSTYYANAGVASTTPTAYQNPIFTAIDSDTITVYSNQPATYNPNTITNNAQLSIYERVGSGITSAGQQVITYVGSGGDTETIPTASASGRILYYENSSNFDWEISGNINGNASITLPPGNSITIADMRVGYWRVI